MLYEVITVYVNSSAYAMHMGNNAIDSWLTIENADLIRQVIDNSQVVFSNNYGLLLLLKATNRPSNHETLLHIQITRRFIKKVNIRISIKSCSNRNTLKLTTAKHI